MDDKCKKGTVYSTKLKKCVTTKKSPWSKYILGRELWLEKKTKTKTKTKRGN